MSTTDINSSFLLQRMTPLSAKSVLKPVSKRAPKSVASALMLTSLVDCFTILVVYLLVATSIGAEEINIPKGMALPLAANGESLEQGIRLVVDNSGLFVDERKISVENLAAELQRIKKISNTDVVIIQADKKIDYEKMNPAVLASLQAGFTKLRFAVVHEEMD